MKADQRSIASMEITEFDIPLPCPLIVNSVQFLAILAIGLLVSLPLVLKFLDTPALILNLIINGFHLRLLLANLLPDLIGTLFAFFFHSNLFLSRLGGFANHVFNLLLPPNDVGLAFLPLGLFLLQKPFTF
ncbi:uncharacterized protein BP01DRAFT_35782 [Aspergillus saccharolyticus JOP 1030-1]|uniref:Uncharacterized protein n=1 Tax=Aspergillus saccharolyticus JOP 1030-1 TaxID=1450539 RepID=A0A318ZMJ2_9EURO|nr:hypothetical protein BP01DRAFT_35782 [Aspergillus saccharolyticus JOP 1030-1]PYH45653.1 hypothetical protein BP01DRAFT_35782 [Aspergillus saccharolyticus JOP 1030-1]